MRNAFIAELTVQAEVDKDIFLITADLGFGVLDDFQRCFPRQFLNVGVAEQNMTGIAAGLALEGKKVFTYSIGNFPTLRCLEQIRNDVCYHRCNVTIVTVGGGFAYGQLGMSHHATEDLAIMRALPNLNVFAPGDPLETKALMQFIAENIQGPNYLRLGRAGEVNVHTHEIKYQHGKALQILEGEEGGIVLFSTGGMLKTAYDAALALKKEGVSVSLYSFLSLKPLDENLIQKMAKSHALILTLEEHSKLGGLGGAVAEVMAEMPAKKARLKRVGLEDCYTSVVGDQEYLKQHYGLDVLSIKQHVLSYITLDERAECVK